MAEVNKLDEKAVSAVYNRDTSTAKLQIENKYIEIDMKLSSGVAVINVKGPQDQISSIHIRGRDSIVHPKNTNQKLIEIETESLSITEKKMVLLSNW